MSTIKDVASLAQVSTATVSIILNGKSDERKISKETQEKVMAAIKELDYHPNISARKLRNQSDSNTPTIALYWASDDRVHLMSRFLIGLQKEAMHSNHNFDIVICPYQNDFLYLEKGLKSRTLFNAAIIANTSISDMDYLEETTPEIPVVLFNRNSKKYSAVYVDEYQMGEKAALLFAKNGHKNAGIILASSVYSTMGTRSKGFVDTCKKNNIEVSPSSIIPCDNTMESGVQAAKQFLKIENLPKALFCCSDNIALGVLHVFNNQGIKVPQDVEIIAVGMNNVENAKYSNPPLTVVNTPMEEMAKECLKLISDLVDNKIGKSTSKLFDTELIIRDSSK